MRRQLFQLSSLLLLPGITGCFDTEGREYAKSGIEVSQFRGLEQCVQLEETDQLAADVLALVNEQRAAADAGLAPVVMSDRLARVADDYACQMIEESFFDHFDPYTHRGPADRAVAGRYTFYAIGENLAAGPTSAEEVLELWMNSAEHREIILDPNWTEMGLAVRGGGEYAVYWVQLFGSPAKRQFR